MSARGAGASARRGAALGLLAAAATALVLWTARAPSGPREERLALSPQECGTECQSRQTDCIDTCDGDVACERRCTEAGLRCVAACRGRGLDAGVGGAGGSASGGSASGGSASGGSAGRGGSGGASGTGGTSGAAGAR